MFFGFQILEPMLFSSKLKTISGSKLPSLGLELAQRSADTYASQKDEHKKDASFSKRKERIDSMLKKTVSAFTQEFSFQEARTKPWPWRHNDLELRAQKTRKLSV
ncbi:hypothetical protein CEXT_621711 [Caerostris extrusa]|uniref:Uncharacterized protein n=1 Tax=Caerostris extrusa TaxID=172846 RepID=A0AAV4TDU5_CAEEX|nr:hypothetical protein CEXT_621711 [Caerostris extrusa]